MPAGGLISGYRPWLDGLRAVAVLMVVVQHTMGRMPLDLGYVGVGLFFALSGYLITSLLLDERAARGSVSLRRFYLRRGARLVPALLLMLAVCDSVFVVQHDYGPVRGSIAAVTYTSNYAVVISPGSVPGYGPTWSLAVEEHFYILWPLVLLAVTGRYGLRTALKATLAVCLAALLWRSVLGVTHASFDLIGIGSVERADALLYGCAAAIAIRLGWRPRRWMTWAGVVVVAALPFAFTHESYPALILGNAILAIAAASVVVGLDYSAPTWMRRVLSVSPLVTIGVLSYGIYLWHGPLMRVADNFGLAGRGWRGVAVVVAVLAAGLSHRFVETPVRNWARRRSVGRKSNTPTAPSGAVDGVDPGMERALGAET